LLDKHHPGTKNYFYTPFDKLGSNVWQQLPQSCEMGSYEQGSHFKKIQKFKADYTDATFTQYESQRTGMRVVVVDRKGPKAC
jgi:hypothetical protein